MNDRVFAVGYRRLPPSRPPRWIPWPIARTALSLAWRQRSTKLGFALCAMSMFGCGLVLTTQVLTGRYVDDNLSDARATLVRGIVGDVHGTLAAFISTQTLTSALLLAILGGGLIAEDRRTGAIELYFSRPLRRRDYMLGKLLAAGLTSMGSLVAPFVLLWLLVVGMVPPDAAAPLSSLLVPGLLSALVAAVMLTTTIVGLSAVAQRGRTVGALYAIGMILLSSLGDGLPEAGHAWAGYLSPLRNVQTIGNAALRASGDRGLLSLLVSTPETNPSVAIALLAVLGLSGLGLGLLWWRVRREVDA